MIFHLPKLADRKTHHSSLPPEARLAKDGITHHFNVKPAFTLIELLVVIGILTVLLAIVLIAVNPAKQFAQANNTQRRSDVNAILNSIHQYAADNRGNIPTGITTATKTICLVGTDVPVANCPVATGIDLCTDLTTKYLADMPKDPKDGVPPSGSPCAAGAAGYNTLYTVSTSASDNRITVTATAESEGGTTPTISVTR